MIVYGSSMSPFVRKVMAVLAEKGIAYDLKPVGIGSDDPEFRAASPFGKMPALVDDDFALADSSAIVHYLDARYPAVPLLPAEPRARGRTVWFDEFADTILFAAIVPMFFNRVVAPRFLKRDGDLAAAAKAEAETVPPVFDWLETQLPASGHLVGEALTLADLAVASPLINFDHCGGVIDACRHPRLAAFAAAMHARVGFAATLAFERKILGR